MILNNQDTHSLYTCYYFALVPPLPPSIQKPPKYNLASIHEIMHIPGLECHLYKDICVPYLCFPFLRLYCYVLEGCQRT